ncbi:D-glycero-alpha-D-manno-heptose-1,7-bisphosphate 7-phosphatase [Streptomyces atacamensis]|jgi:D-glycero-D-manno-heptose 1,7-bisphosphate phosphatase|uniref:D-glycero-alpha-D-manno-heptose-1,7-bisphosphate 7-phosphatase n=1 Tax=Streptomyces atacamensis TaxID=531966 RepID=UPI00399D5677
MTAVRAVLLDRDGTLVEDVPYNGDPALVRPMPGAAEAMALLRSRGVPAAVVTNQSGIARGLIGWDDMGRVHARIDELLGPFHAWAVCPHGPDDGCACRKPAPALVLDAARRLGAAPAECVVIGDIGSDVDAARAAGARGILVPTPVTLPEEVREAPAVAPDLLTAVRAALDGPWPRPAGADGRTPVRVPAHAAQHADRAVTAAAQTAAQSARTAQASGPARAAARTSGRATARTAARTATARRPS